MLTEWILSASVLTAAVLALRLIFRRRISQKLQYWLWLPVLLRLLIPVPLFHARYSVAGAAAELAPAVFAAPAPVSMEGPGAPVHTPAPVSSAPAATTPADGGIMPSAAPVTTPAPALAPAVTVPSAELPEAPAPSLRPAPTQPRLPDAGGLLARLWLAGSVASGLWLLGVNLRFSQRLRIGRREMRRQGRLPVYVSPEAASPCLFGLLRPAIYLTEACETVPEGQLRQILLHEETHYKQLDHLWGSLRCLALAVWWWNPLVWLAAACSRRDGELSCDEKVMLFLGEEARLDYGHTLVALLPAKAPRPMLSAATLSGGARAMKERLDRIVKKPKAWVLAAVAVLLLALAAVGCTFAGKPAETPKPDPRPVITDLVPNRVRVVTCTGTEGELYTLRKGGEGFDEAYETLLGLKGVPCDAPEGLQTRKLKLYQKWEWVTVHPLTLAWGEGKTCACFDKEWFLLEDFSPEMLIALFERGERTQLWSPAPDAGGMTEDGSLEISTEKPVYELADVHYGLFALLNHDFGEGPFKPILEAPSGTTVNVAYENKGRETICCEYADLGLEFLREGTWVRLQMANPYSGGGFDHTHVIPALAPGELTSDFFSLLMFEDLEPGDYRICVPYTTGEERDPEKPWDHVAYAYFRLSDEKPEIEPEEESLLKDMTPEEIDSVSLTLHTWGTYTLRRGMEGFDEAAGLLFSLRGIPCQMPAAGPSVQWTLDFGMRASLEYDGKRVRGFFSDHWLDLSAMGRPDESLAAIFERCGERYAPEAVAVDYRGRIEDGSMTVIPEHAAYDYQTVQTAIAQEKQYYLATGDRSREPDGDDVKLTLENHLDGSISRDDVIRLEALRDGEWVGLSPYSGYASLLTPVEVPAGETKEAWLPLHMFNDPLTPGRYRVSILYSVPNEDGTNDLYYEHVAFGEFEITDGAPPPSPASMLGPGEEWLLEDRTAAEIDAIQYHLFSWETFTLRRGMEGFDEALDLLLALRGAPSEAPAAGLRVMTSLDFGLHVNLEYGGETLWGSLGRRWLDLSAMGRPDKELRSIFERYGEKYVPEARTEDHEGQALDGRMKVSAQSPVYDYDAVQAAIGQRKRDYLATGDRTHEPDASVVKLTLENASEDDLAYGDLSLEVRRDGAWYRVWLFSGFGSQAIYQWLGAGETKEHSLSLSCYDDPLTPGLYRVVIPYGVSGRSIKLNRIAWAEFTISDGVTEPEPWDGKEQLMGMAEPETVSSILCQLPYEDRYTLREGDMGFASARDFLFSLRGTPCERPDFLVLRSFAPDEGAAVTLGFDGERVYGCLGTGLWLLLDAPGRPDQELTEVFLRWGEKEVYTATYPSEYEDKTVDVNVTLTLDKTFVDRNALLAEMAAYREEYREWGEQAAERYGDFTLRATLENNSWETIHFGEYAALETLQDGEWRTIPMRSGFGYFDIAHILEAGGVYDNLGVSFLCYYEEILTPGRYRLSLSYKPGRIGNPTHVAYAEFEITDGPPQPKTYIPIWQDYPATESRGAYHLSFRVPADWSSVDLSPEEAAQQGLLYLPGGTEDRHYLRDESGRIIGAYGCASYEAAEELPEAVYAALVRSDGWRFDVEGSYAPVFAREFGENARVDVVCSGEYLRGLTGQPQDKINEGALSYDRELRVYAAVELEPGLLTEEEMLALAMSLYMEHEEPSPEAGPEPVARFIPEPELFGSYEEARADTEAISFQWVDKPHSYEMAVKSSDPITFDLERAYPGFGTLLCGHLPDTSPYGNPTYLFFLTEEGVRYRLPVPCTLVSDLPLDDGGSARAEEGKAFRMEFPAEDRVRWWTFADKPINIFGNLYDPESMTEPEDPMLRGGTVVWALDLDTMEVSVYYQ